MFHDQKRDSFFEVKVECVILDDGILPKLLDIDKILLKFKDVLLIHRDDLDCVYFFRFFVLASVHTCVSALADHLEKYVFFVEGVQIIAILFLILIGVFA